MDPHFFPELLGFEDLWDAALSFERRLLGRELCGCERFQASWRLVRALVPLVGLPSRPAVWLRLEGPDGRELEIDARNAIVREVKR